MVVNMDYNDIKNIDISKIDKNKCFLHYTNKNNIDSIFKFGLESVKILTIL